MFKRSDVKDVYSLSPLQQGMLFHYIKEGESESTVYFEQTLFSVNGDIDVELFENAFNRVVETHDILRTVFIYKKIDIPQQVVLKKREAKVRFEDISPMDEEGKFRYIEDFKREDIRLGFDLKKDIPMRISVIKTDHRVYKISWSYHHIIMDGWCLWIVMKDLLEAYRALKEGAPPDLEPGPPYSTYIKWLQKKDNEEGLKYWAEYLRDYHRKAGLPKGETLPGPGKYKAGTHRFVIDKVLSRGLEAIAKTNRVTVNSLFQTMWGILLQRYNNTDDVVFGAVVSGRPYEIEGVEEMVGLFINTIPVRITTGTEDTRFSTLVKAVHDREARSKAYEYLQLAEIQSNSLLNGDLLDHFIAFENFPVQEEVNDLNKRQTLGFTIESEGNIQQTNYDFLIVVVPGDPIHIVFKFNSLVYADDFMKRTAGHLKEVITRVTENPGIDVNTLNIITAEERHLLLHEFNDTETDYPRDKTIHRLFEEQAERTPDSVALSGIRETRETREREETVTYCELNRWANRVAHYLREKGVGPDIIVGLMVGRSVGMIVGILGILKAGGAYLAIDPVSPRDRVEFMLTDCRAPVLLTGESVGGALNKVGNPGHLTGCTDLAAVFYTSGSTGTPKGVLVEHRNVVNVVEWFSRRYELGRDTPVILLSNYTFDACMNQVFGALLRGAPLYVPHKGLISDIDALRRYIERNGIYLINFVPALIREMLGPGPKIGSVTRVISGGEALDGALKDRLVDLGYIVHNQYGPTETTIDALVSRCGPGRVVLGKPISNARCYILNKTGGLVPIGAPGEIHIAGTGVTRGYLNNPDLTNKTFCGGPGGSFSKEPPGRRRHYKTGDLGRLLPSGPAARGPYNIEFLGRIDRQVKVRGYRIELGEIESRLLKKQGIRQAVVLDKKDKKGDAYLCAYIVSDHPFESPGLVEFLSKDLPDYMIPAYFVPVETIPLTPNGKIDRNALPEPGSEKKEGHIPIEDKTGRTLAGIWADVLGIDRSLIGLDSNFFQLGGHSLKAAVLAARMHRAFNVNVPLEQLFRSPTLGELAGYITGVERETFFAVPAAEKKEYYPLSPAQKRMYILRQMELGGVGYNLTGAVVLEGELDTVKLEGAFQRLIQRHESLRTAFEMVNDEPVQRIHDSVEFKVEDPPVPIKNFTRPFDLSRAPLLRVGLAGMGQNAYTLVVDMHHIVTDGTSMDVFIKELTAVYAGEELPALRIQYKDFSRWQNSPGQRERIKGQEEYWLRTFGDEIPVLSLPLDYPRPAVKSFEGAAVGFDVSAPETEALKRLAAGEGATLYMVLLAVTTVFLSKITNQRDIVVGTPVAARRHVDLERVIGMFVNTLALRNYSGGEQTFGDFLKAVKRKTLDAFENQEYQFEDLVERAAVNRDAGRNPLFDFMLVLQNEGTGSGETPVHMGGLKIKPLEREFGIARVDLDLTVGETGDGLVCTFNYCTKLFKETTVEGFINYFKRVIRAVINDPCERLAEIEILSAREKQQVLVDFNDTRSDYPGDRLVHELFEDQAAKTPDRIAVTGEGLPSPLSYGELNRKSRRLAAALAGKGVSPGDIVALMVDTPLDIAVGILGILKAGAAYLPIDPLYPTERIRRMLADSNAKMLLNESSIADIPTRPLDHSSTHLTQPTQLCYVIYTSGSTGEPRGVMVDHGGVVNYVWWRKRAYDYTERDVTLQLLSYCFDAFAGNFYPALLSGGELVMAAGSGRLDPARLNGLVKQRGISTMGLVPGVLEVLLDNVETEDLERLRFVVLGGETTAPALLRKVGEKAPGARVIIEYGPTEATVAATSNLNVDPGQTAVIGKPIANARVYILDPYSKPVPAGVPGELCIAGPGVARGYLNQPELTNQKFCLNRSFWEFRTLFSKRVLAAGGTPWQGDPLKFYKTGDLARWLPDGSIMFLGRFDSQVKIRGYRVELDEIANRLRGHPAVNEAVVIDRRTDRDSYLCAYFTTRPGGEPVITHAGLKEYLLHILPEYMVPAFFVRLDGIPLTRTGKIDRNALPAPEINAGGNYRAPRDGVEEKLVEIWTGILGLEKNTVGIDDDFFRLGGHSLKATVLAGKIHKEFNVEISLGEIFKTPTIAAMASSIESRQKYAREGRDFTPVEAAEKRDYYPLSPAQKRLYIVRQLDENDISYNMPSIFPLAEGMDNEKLETAFRTLILRHDSLRTSFETVGDEPVQRVRDTVPFDIEFHEAGAGAVVDGFVRPFDLSRPPLLRVGVITTGEAKHYLALDMHHIITDGTSQNILKREFMQLFSGTGDEPPLPPLRLQYKDYSQWLNHPDRRETVKRQEIYWTRLLSDEPPVLNLPLDFPRPGVRSFEGSRVYFFLSPGETAALKHSAGEAGATLYMMLLSLFTVFLSKLSGQEDIIVGTPIAARRHEDLGPIVGMFVNTLVMRNYPSGDKPFKIFLEEVKEQTLGAFENQEYPFEELVDRVLTRRDTARNPLFDVMFNLQNQAEYPGDIPADAEEDWEEPPHEYKNRTSKFDMNFTAVQAGGGENERLFFSVEYCTRLFKQESIRGFIDYFKKILRMPAPAGDCRLSQMEILTDEEKTRLLEALNDTAADFPGDKTIHRLFEEQVERTPGNTALVFEGAALSYRELNEKSHVLAGMLMEKGVRPDTVVGLLVERSMELIIGIIGILKAGGAYLPLDPGYPGARIQYMLADSGAAMVLKKSDIQSAVPGTRCRMPDVSPSNLIYVIYTSGSTGKPRGVMLEHRNLVNLMAFQFRYTNLDFSSVFQFATICFDASFHEIFSTLLSGGKLSLVHESRKTDIPAIFGIMESNGVKTIFMPMSMLSLIFNEEEYRRCFPGCVKHIVTAGEQVVVGETFRDCLREKGIYLHNHYGPAETHVVTTFTMDPAGDIPVLPPIGKPVSNTAIHILDRYGNVQPPGVPGELHIGGVQVGRGYLNNPEQTAERFTRGAGPSLTTPYPLPLTPSYRTGDLGRLLPGHNIDFQGRFDHQVKIRGFRVELGEIESRLMDHPAVKEAVVGVRGEDGDGGSAGKYLCAYIVTGEEAPGAGLRQYLSDRLPDYMVPAYFVTLDKLPLTPTGKINRKALLEMSVSRPAPASAESAGSDMERLIAGVWKEVLNLETVGVEDNFFEIGGNSISILKVHARLKKRVETDTPVVKLFKFPTIRSYARYLEEETETEAGETMDNRLTLSGDITRGKDRLKEGTATDIAVIGMAGIFPGAKDIHEFWDNLKNGRESITFFSDEELETIGVSPRLAENPDYVKARGIIEDSETFDYSFFNYTPMEAGIMDPQARLFHQCVWAALEDAGYDSFSYTRRIGLYAGSSPNVWWEVMAMTAGGGRYADNMQSFLLRDKDFMCTRIAYKLDLKGPGYNVQTACSTSLTAVHLAVLGLLTGDCEMALAGGVTVSFPEKGGHLYREGTINSPDGHCRAFDAESKGIIGGNGAGVVVLKPLDDAVSDGDFIYAVIKGSAVNNDGVRKVGFTAPSVEGQAEVVRAAQYMAGVAPETVTYIEAHGTGTELGDPVEVEALKMAFNTDKRNFCGIGSVKTNIGHLDTAAGAAGFIKTVMALNYRLIPPTLHFKTPNPKLGLENSPFYVVSTLTEWKPPGPGLPLRAGVSSLGIGGTNAHVVLEGVAPPALEGPDGHSPDAERRAQGAGRQLLLLSAQTPSALDQMTANLVNYLKGNLIGPIKTYLQDVAHTLQVGRRSFKYRKMLVCGDVDGAVESLSSSRYPEVQTAAVEKEPRVVFLFPGQGAQYVDMARQLYESENTFREEMDRCFKILAPLLKDGVKEILYPSPGGNKSDPGEINRTEIAQPVLFAVEYALAVLLMKWGVKPSGMMGHSIGEYVAACLAGVFSLEGALTLVATRGRLMQRLPGGAMMGIDMPEETLATLLKSYPEIALAAVNSSSLCVVSGPRGAVRAFGEEMNNTGFKTRELHTSHAFHSGMMDPVLKEFEETVRAVPLNKPRMRFISNVRGDWITETDAVDPAYWAGHLRRTVRFADGAAILLTEPDTVFIEVGPGRTLGAFLQQHKDRKNGHRLVNTVRHPREKADDGFVLTTAAGRLWLYGVPIDWAGSHPPGKRYRVPLPTYPFEGKRFGFEESTFKHILVSISTAMEGRDGPSGGETGGGETSTGALPGTTESYDAPRNDLEENIARIWKELLGFERIGIHENFFHLNGDSLTATKLVARVREVYPVELSLKDFFEGPTIAHLAEVVKKLLVEMVKDLSKEEKEEMSRQ